MTADEMWAVITRAREAAKDPAACQGELYDALVHLIEEVAPVIGFLRLDARPLDGSEPTEVAAKHGRYAERLHEPLDRARAAAWAWEVVRRNEGEAA
jgi:hypothetical protein